MSGLVTAPMAVRSRAFIICPKTTSRRVESWQIQRYIHRSSTRASTGSHLEHKRHQATSEPISYLAARSSTPQSAEKSESDKSVLEHGNPVLYGRSKFTHRKREKLPKDSLKHIENIVPGIQDYTLQATPQQKVLENLSEPGRALLDAIRTGTPRTVLRTLIRYILSVEREEFAFFLKGIPSTTFSEILRYLDPDHFVGAYQELHRHIATQASVEQLSLPVHEFETYYKFADLFLSEISLLIRARSHQTPLTVEDYSYLLKCARATGNLREANSVWSALNSSIDGKIKPDVECFNNYIGAKVWSEKPKPYYFQRDYLYTCAPRSWGVPQTYLGASRYGENGIKGQVVELFHQMVSAGFTGNEMTFCYMMMAFAKETDMKSIDSIFQRVWGIDVGALLSTQNYERPAKKYATTSPFYPTNQLLYTIAHAYAINNQVPAALRLIDYVSRQYSIDISADVWEELLTWTYRLSFPQETWNRTFLDIDDGTVAPNELNRPTLPSTAVENLWKTMTSKPYNVKPTIKLIHTPIKRLIQDKRFTKALALMQQGRAILRREVYALGYLLGEVRSLTSRNPRDPALKSMTEKLHIGHIKLRKNRILIREWVHRILTIKVEFPHLAVHEWYTEELPNIVKSFNLFLPYKIFYPVATGQVGLLTESWKLNQARQWRYRYGDAEARRFRGVRRITQYHQKPTYWEWSRWRIHAALLKADRNMKTRSRKRRSDEKKTVGSGS